MGLSWTESGVCLWRFVEIVQLPMDSRRRWLKRGETVQFTVGVGAKGKGPQAMGVVGAVASVLSLLGSFIVLIGGVCRCRRGW